MRLTRRRREPSQLQQAKQRRDERLRRSRDAPEPVPTQDEQRHRRRQHLTVVYDGRFDLTAETEAILEPLAGRSDITRYPHLVREVTTAVHQMRLDLEQLLVERDARRRISDLPYEKRGRARDLIVAAWQRPTAPVIDPTGPWVDALADHAAPLTDGLREYLARATPPGQTRGGISISERVESAVRELDRAVTYAVRRLDQIAANRTDTGPTLPPELKRLSPTQAELDALGITTT